MDIYQRFLDLPRGRRGDEVIVIVPESELLELIGDAQASEARLVQDAHLRVLRDLGQTLKTEVVAPDHQGRVAVACPDCRGLGGEHFRGCPSSNSV